MSPRPFINDEIEFEENINEHYEKFKKYFLSKKQRTCPSCIHGRRNHVDFHWCTKSYEFESDCIGSNRDKWEDKFPEFLSEEDMEI